jgi:hypothetical protein
MRNEFSSKRHLELQIKTLENAPRDAEKRLLQVRRRQKEEAMDIEDAQRVVIEIEMLKVVLHLVRHCNNDMRTPNTEEADYP